jgi:uncharacterized protein YjiS (DUF1127 family)
MAQLIQSSARHTSVQRGSFSLSNALGLWRSRRALAQLDARLLEDIGVSAKDASNEATRAPWDVPAYWLK